MGTSSKWSIIVQIISLLSVLSLVIWNISKKDNNIDNNEDRINELINENQELKSVSDSLNVLIQLEKSRYDSLLNEIDLSEIKYNDIKDKYNSIRNSVKYLNADESINFLCKEVGL